MEVVFSGVPEADLECGDVPGQEDGEGARVIRDLVENAVLAEVECRAAIWVRFHGEGNAADLLSLEETGAREGGGEVGDERKSGLAAFVVCEEGVMAGIGGEEDSGGEGFLHGLDGVALALGISGESEAGGAALHKDAPCAVQEGEDDGKDGEGDKDLEESEGGAEGLGVPPSALGAESGG